MKKFKNDSFESKLKEEWINELESNIKGLDENIKSLEIPKKKKTFNFGFFFSRNFKKMTASICVLSVCLAFLIGTLFFIKPSENNLTIDDKRIALTVDINPSSAFITDKDGITVKVISLNSDADVMSFTDGFESKVINLPIEKAISNYIDIAASLGYFNLESDAVKVSLTEMEKERKEIELINDELSNYFRKKGVLGAVAFDFQKSEDFAENLNINSSDIYSSLLNKDNSFSDRIYSSLSDKESDEIEKIYKNLVNFNYIDNYLKNQITENIDFIADSLHLLNEINILNNKIKYHKDNPSLILKDYWALKDSILENKYTETFKTLVDSMTEKLSVMEKTFNEKIESSYRLGILIAKYSFLNLEDGADELQKAIKEIINSPFNETVNSILELLHGKYDSQIKNLLNSPKSKEEFKDKLDKYLSMQKDERLKSAKDEYDKKRNEISKTDYENYIKNLEIKYGSLLNYFESQK